MEKPLQDRELNVHDLVKLGYGRDMAEQIILLLSQEDVLEHYIRKGQRMGCSPITRVSENYPRLLRYRLGLDSPGCLWVRGEVSLLNSPSVSLVGSRDLAEPNRRFAEAVGIHAARQGLTLVSGNARGADQAAQNACLNAGGCVISIVADELLKHSAHERILYVSEDGFDDPFTAQRAIRRNRCIHALGRMVFVAQATLNKGGTWDGTVKNLHNGWSSVACFRDGSEASCQLEQRGAFLVDTEDLKDFGILCEDTTCFFDR